MNRAILPPPAAVASTHTPNDAVSPWLTGIDPFPMRLAFENSRTYDQRLEKLQGYACGRRWSVLGADFDGWLHVIF